MNSEEAEFRRDIAEWVLNMPVAAALGFTFDELAGGRAVTRLRWRPQHSHTPGAFQASPVAALADFTGASAGASLLSAGATAATVDYTAKFLTEARGEELIARAQVMRAGSTLTVSVVEVFVATDGAETLCAAAFVTIRKVLQRAHVPVEP